MSTITYVALRRYTCPREGCARAFERVLALQEHWSNDHRRPQGLADKYRFDFYNCALDDDDNDDDDVSSKDRLKTPSNVATTTTRGRKRHRSNDDDVATSSSKRREEDDKPPKIEMYEIRSNADIKQEMMHAIATNDVISVVTATDKNGDTWPPATADDGATLTSPRVTKFHCDSCTFNTNDKVTLDAHVQTAHSSNSSAEPEVAQRECAAPSVEPATPNACDDASADSSATAACVADFDDGLIKCSHCAYATHIKTSFDKHINTHNKYRSRFTGTALRCGYCAYLCEKKNNMHIHINKFHQDEEKKHFCVHLENGKEVRVENASGNQQGEAVTPEASTSTGTGTAVDGDGTAAAVEPPSSSQTAQPPTESEASAEQTKTTKEAPAKMFRCSKCVYRTKSKQSLAKHTKSQHERFLSGSYTGRAFKCGYCECMCTQKGNTVGHVQKFHPKEEMKIVRVQLENSHIVSQAVVDVDVNESGAGGGSAGGGGAGGGGAGGIKQKVNKSPPLARTTARPITAAAKKKHKCTKCAYSTSSAWNLTVHMSRCQQVAVDFTGDVHKCPYCDFVGQSKAGVLTHLRCTHPTRERTFKVLVYERGKVVNESASDQRGRVKSASDHRGRGVKCPSCHYTTRSKESLSIHMASHKPRRSSSSHSQLESESETAPPATAPMSWSRPESESETQSTPARALSTSQQQQSETERRDAPTAAHAQAPTDVATGVVANREKPRRPSETDESVSGDAGYNDLLL